MRSPALERWIEKVVAAELPSDWTIDVDWQAPKEGNTLHENKKIILHSPDFSLVLHEIAHAQSGRLHDGVYLIHYEELVKRYCNILFSIPHEIT